MKFIIIKIEEDNDFGCEERSEDSPVMLVVTLEDHNKEKAVIRYPDQKLYENDINEGDEVILNEKGELHKPITGDWTKKFSSKDIDISEFSEMLHQIQMGMKIKCICPFCGGNVGLLEKIENKNIIGCDSCDMRITLETK